THLLAISGLHFGLIALFFHTFLRLFLPQKFETLALMLTLTLYLFFIGNTPSVQRAWIFAMVFLFGRLVDKKSYSLNTLGVALLISLIHDASAATTLSFQLTFLATAGILLFYPYCEKILRFWIPKYSLQEIASHSLLWQHGYLGLQYIRKALSLTIAVHCTLLPLLLYHFHSFFPHSLFYNLFFPSAAALSLFLLLFASLLHVVIPPLGAWLHQLNGHYTAALVALSENPPILTRGFFFEHVSPLAVTTAITLIFLGGILYHSQENIHKEWV
ncbi:MAG: ComEC/Rec2 family competence protein, partial [Chlamydiales bacterium]